MKLEILAALSAVSVALAAPAVTCGVGGNPKFDIKDFVFSSQARYSTPAHLATSQANVTFSLLLPTKPKALSCSATTAGTYPNYFDGTKTYKCVDGKTTSATFKYNFSTQKLAIDAEWTCPALG